MNATVPAAIGGRTSQWRQLGCRAPSLPQNARILLLPRESRRMAALCGLIMGVIGRRIVRGHIRPPSPSPRAAAPCGHGGTSAGRRMDEGPDPAARMWACTGAPAVGTARPFTSPLGAAPYMSRRAGHSHAARTKQYIPQLCWHPWGKMASCTAGSLRCGTDHGRRNRHSRTARRRGAARVRPTRAARGGREPPPAGRRTGRPAPRREEGGTA